MHAALALFLVAVALKWTETGSSIPVTRCHSADYICEGRCPMIPHGAELPSEEDEREGLCLKDSETDACVCWMRNTHQHLQTLFKCEVAANNTIKHVMCLPPPICFPPGPSPGCMIILHCPCTDYSRGPRYGKWRSGKAFILRSKTPVPALTPEKEGTPEQPPPVEEDKREFSVKHLLFLLAFVIAPLLCWCLLTFFHDGRCRKKRRCPETEVMSTERVEGVSEPCPSGPCIPTAPKMESPPPYGETDNPGESCLLTADCGPPPSYEDAVRHQQWRIQELDSE